jgi:predicted nucleic acid-binding protein
MTTAIVDNTVLSNFAHVGRPDLLRVTFDSLVVVQAVMDELVGVTVLNASRKTVPEQR